MVSAADLFEKILVYLYENHLMATKEKRKNKEMNFKTKESKTKPTSVACMCVYLWCFNTPKGY